MENQRTEDLVILAGNPAIGGSHHYIGMFKGTWFIVYHEPLVAYAHYSGTLFEWDVNQLNRKLISGDYVVATDFEHYKDLHSRSGYKLNRGTSETFNGYRMLSEALKTNLTSRLKYDRKADLFAIVSV